MKKLFLCLILCLINTAAYSYQANINIPDSNFLKILIKSFDKNRDGKISHQEAEKIKHLLIQRKKFQKYDLTGIETFKNLEHLHFANADVTSLDLSKLPKLKTFSSHYSKFSTALIFNRNLDDFYFEGSTASLLDLSKTKVSGILRLADNNIGSFISPKNIVSLILIGATTMKSIDISNATKLEFIYSHISGAIIDLSKNIKLKKIIIKSSSLYSPLHKIKLPHTNSLTSLYLENINNTTFTLNNYQGIKDLFIQGNNLSSLVVKNNPNLKKLICDNSKLTNLIISNNPNLEILSCKNNKLDNLDTNKIPKLKDFYCDKNPLIRLNLSNNEYLEFFTATSTKLRRIDITNKKALVLARLYRNPLLEKIYARGSLINPSNIKINECPNLSLMCLPSTMISSYQNKCDNYNYNCKVTTNCRSKIKYKAKDIFYLSKNPIRNYTSLFVIKDNLIVTGINIYDAKTGAYVKTISIRKRLNFIGRPSKQQAFYQKFNINCSDLRRGLYILHLNSNLGVFPTKFMKI
ncbi:hypothetical protein G1K37_07330 [Tenacibaculum dicentrarchi]|nr:hypothetical protein [Tenacibaculum dicentrarchi]